MGGEDIVVFSETQNKDAALAFTRFMLSEEVQLAMGKVGQMPVLTSLAGNADLPDYYPTFQEQLKTANARTPVPGVAQDRRGGVATRSSRRCAATPPSRPRSTRRPAPSTAFWPSSILTAMRDGPPPDS